MIRETAWQLGFTVIRFLILAALAITISSAQAAVLAEERAPARLARLGGVVAAALEEPHSDRADTAPARCPYHFGSDMPAATFCVYRGVAFAGGGEVCATDVVVIWSSLASQAALSVEREDNASAPNGEVYLAFVADPGLVLRATVNSRQGDRAKMVGYTLASDQPQQALAGSIALRTMRLRSSGTADVLSIKLRDPPRLSAGSCAFASYSGTFRGVIQPPSEKQISADIFVGPGR